MGIQTTENNVSLSIPEQAMRCLVVVMYNSSEAIIIHDMDGNITIWNRGAEKMYGYRVEEALEMNIDLINPAGKLAEQKEYFRRLLAGEVVDSFETKRLAKDGSILDVWLTVTKVLEEPTDSVISQEREIIKPIGLDLLERNITMRKRAEAELREKEGLLANIYENVKELEERTEDISQLSEMVEKLQSCQSIEEAVAISALHIRKLFAGSQGALYLINPAKDSAEVIEMWGDSASMANMFMPLKCWAIRRCRTYLVDDFYPGPLCGHINGSPDGQYLCVPIMAHGEVLGIFHLNHPAPESDQQKTDNRVYNEHKCQLAQAIAEHIALVLLNLRLQETLRQHSIRDILTSLFNRRYMEESLTRELRRAEREKRTVGVMMFDIDHFRDFNDRFGHAGGDSLLRELGAFLNARIRGGDIVSRYGGEEFVSVLPGATLEETSIRAEELRQGVKELRIYHQGEPLGQTTISIGVAAFPKNGLTGDEILKSADKALYRAKNEGRDRVIVASTIN